MVGSTRAVGAVPTARDGYLASNLSRLGTGCPWPALAVLAVLAALSTRAFPVTERVHKRVPGYSVCVCIFMNEAVPRSHFWPPVRLKVSDRSAPPIP